MNMMRLFERHKKRRTFLLDGLWKFRTDPEKRGFSEKWFENFPAGSTQIVVPSCWNNEFGLYEYEGVAWYSTEFTAGRADMNLLFHAVTGQAEVYVDGIHVGSHYGGFAGFNVLLRNIAVGMHTLTIAVDNTHDSMNTIPLTVVDWYHYGGIIRSVEVMELPDLWIKGCRIDYKLDQTYICAELSMSLALESSHDNQSGQLKVTVDGVEVFTCLVEIEEERKTVTCFVRLNDIKLWDIGQPNLYLVRFEIGEDDLAERIGFREIKAENKKLLLNGRELFLKGVNRHEEHPDWGFSMPLKLMKKDMDIIKDLGCNAIRGSHYPNSELFLDFCDQEGILFWEEIPMWGFPEAALLNPLIRERGLAMHEEMVKRDCHHPCIILWGLHNEADTSTQAGYEITKAFADKIRSLDGTRPLTYATNRPLEDICLQLADVISLNVYIGWYSYVPAYSDDLNQWPEFLADFKKKLEVEKLGGKPVIMSEFGAAGIYGEHTFEANKWTENYQEKYLDYTLGLFTRDVDITGTYIWQFSDIRVCKEKCLDRARSFNNKGILNEYRKPKLSYWTVRRIFRQM